MSLGPAQQYLCQFNNYTLPGYVQNESIESTASIADHYAPYNDGSLSDNTGLANKTVTVSLKVWEQDYLSCKNQVQTAATIVRSKRDWADLYVMYSDRHYEAMTRSIRMQKDAGTSVRTLDYEVEFECKPWLISDTLNTLAGTGTVTTDSVARTINNGGWTPTTITVTGTNVTISGYTADGQFAGFISISGAVSNMVINTENYTATIGGTNRNDLMLYADYKMYVGPAKTTFVTTGASSCSIEYYDRWYI